MTKPTYEELERRLIATEAQLAAIRPGRADSIIGDHGALVVRLAEAEARAAHIKQVLLSIRHVNQLIIKESDRVRLIEQSCENLTRTMGYHNAWIALLDDALSVVTMTASSGFPDGFSDMLGLFGSGELPGCIGRAFEKSGITVVEDPNTECPGCPYSGTYDDRAGLVGPLVFAEKTYGVLAVSVPADYARDEEEQGLFEELTGDISFALYKIEMEERRQETEQLLRESEELLRATGRMARVGGWELDAETLEVTWTEETYRIHEVPSGRKPSLEEAINFFHEDDRERLGQAIKNALERGEPYDMDLRFVTATGKPLWTRTRCMADTVNGKTIRLRGTFQDITERKEAKEALKESERFLNSTLDALSANIAILDEEGSIVLVNESWRRFAGDNDAGLARRDGVGVNYLAVCDSAKGDWSDGASEVARMIRDMIKGESEGFEWEYPCHSPSEKRWFTLRATRFLVGGKVRVALAHENITARKESEQAVAESEQRFRIMFERAPIGIALVDMDHHLLAANKSYCDLLGRTEDELRKLKLSDFTHPDDLEENLRLQQELGLGKIPSFQFEKQFIRKDGTVSTGLLVASLISNEDGAPLHYLGMVLNITERKKAEESLRSNQAMLARTESIAHVGSWEWDVENDEVTWSDELFRIFQRNPSDGAPSFADHGVLYPPEDLQRLRAVVQEAVTTGKAYEIELQVIRKDGEPRVCVARGHAEMGPHGRATRLYGSLQDITERKQVERKLQQINRRLEESQRIAKIGTWEWNPITGETYWSDETYRIFGLEPGSETPSYELAKGLTHPEDIQEWQEAFAKALDGENRFIHDSRVIRTDGSVIWVNSQAKTIRDEQGKAILVFGTAQEITDRKLAERALLASEVRYRRLFEAAKDGILILDADTGRIVDVNPFMTELLGFSHEQMLDKHLWDIGFFEDVGKCQTVFAELQSKKYVRYEGLPLQRVGGGVLDAEFVSNVYQVNDVKVIQCNIRDITERKERERLLRQKVEALRLSEILASVGYFERNWHTDEGYWSEGFFRILDEEPGTPPSHQEFMEYVHEDDRERVARHVSQTIERHEPMDIEFRIVSASGTVKDIHGIAETDYEVHGEPLITRGTFQDITQRKRAQESLRLSEERYRAIFDNAAVGIDVVDREGRFIQVNEARAAMLGYSQQELLNHTILDITHPDDVAVSRTKYSEMVRGETGAYSLQKRYVKKSGEHVWADVSASAVLGPDGSHIATVGVASDITDRVKAEEALRESEGRVRAKLDSILSPEGNIGTLELADVMDTEQVQALMNDFYGVTKIGMAIVDLEGNVLVATGWQDICTQFHRVHPETRQNCLTSDRELSQGVEEGSFKLYKCLNNMWDISTPIIVGGHHLGNLFLGQFLFEGEEPDLQVFRNQAREYGFDEAEYLSALKRVPRWTRETVESVMGFYSNFSRMLATLSYGNVKLARHLGQTERLVSSLRESEERYRAVVNNLNLGILVIDRNMEIVAVNAFLESHYPHVQAGKDKICFAEFNDPPRSSPCSGCPCVLTFQDGKIHESETDAPIGDRITHYRIVSCPVKNDRDEVELVVELVEDITERRSLYSQLAQAQKMEAIGTLAGGVAHDFNNILQVAIGYSELMLGEDALPDYYRSDLKKIYDSASRGADLVKRLLTFSRKTEMTFQPLSLNQRITDLRNMLERTLPKMIGIELRLEKYLDRINADPTQMDQVLMNLAVNARDAMPDGGKLLIETAGVMIDAQDVKTHLGLNPGRYVLLSVTDTGSGIDKDSLEKIFEPFFTTKGLGEGTGLGLAMVHGIVKQHSGHIICYSEPGAGTTFKIYLPAIEREVETDVDTTGTMAAFGTETILLVDDEEFIRDLGARILTNQGYSVIHAVNGKEALELFKKERARIDLVILDLIMPQMGGAECLKEILKIDPKATVLIASGYSGEASMKDTIQMGAKGFVNKPFRVAELLRDIRRVLDHK